MTARPGQTGCRPARPERNGRLQPWRRVADSLLLWLVERWARRRYRKRVRKYRKIARAHGTSVRIAVPRSANDKFLWRKLFDRDPRFITLCSKVDCRAWVASRVPELGMARQRWVGEAARDIPARALRGDAVIKPDGGSGQHIFVRDGDYDRDHIVRATRRWLREPYSERYGEWGYRHVPRRLLVESLIRPENGVLDELKIYTFGERVERVVYIRGRFEAIEAAIWEPDTEGNLARSARPAAVADRLCRAPLPDSTEQAIAYARRLGQEFDHMRVDLYTDGTKLWFGELTVYNQSGRLSHIGHEPDSRLTRAWDIRRSNFLRNPPGRGWRAWYAVALKRRLDQKEQLSSTG